MGLLIFADSGERPGDDKNDIADSGRVEKREKIRSGQ
jgi:hypothetical protein